MNINEIKPYKNNARNNARAIKRLARDLREGNVPFDVPIVVDKDNVIIKGHSRWSALVELGQTEIPVIVSENSDEVNKYDRIADNKVQELSRWKPEELSMELRELDLDVDNDEFLGGMDLKFSIYTNDDVDYDSLYGLATVDKQAIIEAQERLGASADRADENDPLIPWCCPFCQYEFLLSRKEVEECIN